MAPASAVPRHHAGDGASWMRIDLDLRNDPGRTERLIEFEAIRPRIVELYVFSKDEATELLSYRGGLEVPGSAPDRLYATSIGGANATELVLYARLVADFTPELRLRFVTERGAFERERRLERYLGPLEGGVIGLTLLLLALWVGRREQLLLGGATLVCCCMVVVHLLMGQDRRIWPEALQQPVVNEILFTLAIGLFMCCALRFTARWLTTETYAPRLARVMRAASWVVVIAFVGLPRLMPREILLIMSVLLGGSLVLMFAAVIRAARARAPGTWIFLVLRRPDAGRRDDPAGRRQRHAAVGGRDAVHLVHHHGRAGAGHHLRPRRRIVAGIAVDGRSAHAPARRRQ